MNENSLINLSAAINRVLHQLEKKSSEFINDI